MEDDSGRIFQVRQTRGEDNRMFPIDKIRHQQEQRLKPALDSWNEAKRNLESAIAVAEAREKEYREIAEDVRIKMEALQLVISMTAELENGESAGPSLTGSVALAEFAAPENARAETVKTSRALPAAEDHSIAAAPHTQNSVVRVTSRRLFAANWRSPIYKSSILQLK
jgi:hypothetical protein